MNLVKYNDPYTVLYNIKWIFYRLCGAGGSNHARGSGSKGMSSIFDIMSDISDMNSAELCIQLAKVFIILANIFQILANISYKIS